MENSSKGPPHAPGRGSDKQHPETPSDANERFKKQQDKDKQDQPNMQKRPPNGQT